MKNGATNASPSYCGAKNPEIPRMKKMAAKAR